MEASEGTEVAMGTVMALYTCITAGAPMQCHPAAQAIAGRGGIRAEVLTSGTIKVGDPIDIIASH